MYWVIWSFSAEIFSVRPGEGREGREMGRSLWKKGTAEVILGLVYCFFDWEFTVLEAWPGLIIATLVADGFVRETSG
jgi:hypothetical protein